MRAFPNATVPVRAHAGTQGAEPRAVRLRLSVMRIPYGVLAFALLTGCTQDRTSALPAEQTAAGVWDDTYSLRDERTIVVTAMTGGGCDSTGHATAAVAETAAVVTISLTVVRPARTAPPGASCPANAVVQRVTVPLTDPLGERTVRDGVGGTVLKQAPDWG